MFIDILCRYHKTRLSVYEINSALRLLATEKIVTITESN
jgi:hypothetical protein